MSVQLPKYFTLKEMTATSTKLPNMPETWEEFIALHETALALDQIREAYGQGIRVTSGYRSAAVNTAVGGSKTSAHRKGMAVDIQPYKNTKANMDALMRLLRINIQNYNIDQLIIYTADGKDPLTTKQAIKWIHIGFAAKPRGQLLFKKG
jgi:hypothetical protein